MSSFELSPDARQRLWRCYSLLLSLADEVEEDTDTDAELCIDQGVAMATEVEELTEQRSDISKVEQEQTEAHGQLQQESKHIHSDSDAKRPV